MKSIAFLFIHFLMSSIHSINRDDCCIITDEGVNDITVKESTLEDVQKAFGEKKIKKFWVKAIEVEIFGHFERKLFYEDLGLTFYAGELGKKHEKNVITTIEITKNSFCLDKYGLGIGSSYHDVIHGCEKADVYSSRNIKGDVHLCLDYENKEFFFSTDDSTTAVVEKIRIR